MLYLKPIQLRTEFTHRVDSSIQLSFEIIVDWATKFEKVLKIQDKSKSVMSLDEVESDGKCNIVCVHIGSLITYRKPSLT